MWLLESLVASIGIFLSGEVHGAAAVLGVGHILAGDDQLVHGERLVEVEQCHVGVETLKCSGVDSVVLM